ncbi:MAG: T9SS type A sorting domain-containing protein [Bacteroidetes bacterium]|nr:T9SS type A sorting domain-containing protein [Bacteroidota bacterium]
MKKIHLGLLICALSTAVHAQGVKFEWAKSMGGIANDNGRSITTDDSGNVLITGTYQDTVDFDPGPATFNLISNGLEDIFIQKLDASGNFIWAKSMGATQSDVGVAITTDASGNVYVTGFYKDTVDFDPGAATFNLTSNGLYDVFIQKLDASGNFIWAKSVGGTSKDGGASITIDIQGNVLITGFYIDTVDFDPGAATFNLTSNGAYDIFIQKLNASGNFIWANSMGAASSDYSNSVTTDASGNVLITGIYQDTVDFDPGAATFNLASNGDLDIFIQKLDAGGNFIWAKSMGGSVIDHGISIAIDTSANVYVTGYYKGTVDFDPGAATFNLTSNGNTDVFIQKLDASGNFIWAKSIGGTSTDICNSICIDASGNVLITGFYIGMADFDPSAAVFNLTSNGFYDVFIEKLDSGGNFIWAISMGGTYADYGYSITTDTSGKVLITGTYRDTVDFDPNATLFNLTSNGNYDVFIQKLSPCTPNTGTDFITACDSYTWIDGNTYTASNNTATDTLTIAAGCDSVVTLNLTINTVDVGVTTTDPTITANATGASYQWLDCNNNYAILIGETSQTFTATANGDYAVEVTENGCIDTSACVTISSFSAVENLLFSGVSIFPNPSSGVVNIDFGGLRNVSIKIFSESGQLVYQAENINTSIHQFKFKEAPGVYFIEVSTNGEMQRYKLIRE